MTDTAETQYGSRVVRIDYDNPYTRAMVVRVCGEEYVPEDGGTYVVERDSCENGAVMLGAALSSYCGCGCDHGTEPWCATTLPENRPQYLPGSFEEFPDGLQEKLKSTDPEDISSFVNSFGICPEDVEVAVNALFTQKRLLLPEDPTLCGPDIPEFNVLHLNMEGIKFYINGVMDPISFDSSRPLGGFQLGILGYDLTGFFGGVNIEFFAATPMREKQITLGTERRREEANMYLTGVSADAGYLIPFSNAVGLQLNIGIGCGWQVSDGEILVGDNEWQSVNGFYMGIRTGIEFLFEMANNFALLPGFWYRAMLVDTPLDEHSAEISVKLMFG